MRTEAVQLLEDGRIDELAALLDSQGLDSQGGGTTTADVLRRLAAQHNRQRSAQSVADIRYEIRWEKSATAASVVSGEDSLWVVIGDDDSATGGPDLVRGIYPTAVTIGAEGALDVTEERIAALAREVIESRSRADTFGPDGRPNNEAPRADA